MHLATSNCCVYTYKQNFVVAKTVSNPFIDNKTTPISIEDQNITYTSFGKVNTITEGTNELLIEYGFDNQRIYSECEEERVVNKGKGKKEKIKTSTKKYYAGSFEEKEIEEKGQIGGKVNQRFLYDYISGPDGLAAVFVSAGNTTGLMFYILKDHIGSITGIVDESGELVAEYSYDAWGKSRNPKDWTKPSNDELLFDRGFTGHEHLELFDLINMNGRVYDPSLGRFLSPDNYVQAPDFTQSFNRYSYCMNNPLRYTDPDGEFITWNIGNGGFGIGLNFTPIGIPLGFGINVGWSDGFSPGVYGEVGYRVGGTGFGSGVTITQSLDYNLKNNSFSTSTSMGAYASLGVFNAGVNISSTYDFATQEVNGSWAVSVGVGFGNDERGIGFNIGYGSGGWNYGMGGYYNSHAWDDNPVYEPDMWNDNGIQTTNNCYSYALDDIGNGNYWGLQPGDAGGYSITNAYDINLDYVINAAISDGQIKKPNFINKLGFGKRGYASVYLVIDQGVDYHWYRQDKGGRWSHKPGITPVVNVDASGRFIKNPARANHNYHSVNYNDGGILLWIKRR